MAIKEFIILEGTDAVVASFDRINVAGERSLQTFRALGNASGGGSSGGGFDKLVEGAKNAGLELENTSQSTFKLSTAFHTLRPILAEAGLRLGEFTALGRLAGSSMIGLGVAVAGAAVVGIATLEQNAARARGTLADLFRSNEKGDQAFDKLSAGAKEFGATVTSMVPGIVAFQTALSNVDKSAQGFVALKAEDLPGGGPRNIIALTEAYNNFIKILRAGRLTQDEAEKSATAFFDTLKNGGPVTKAALQNLPVGTLQLLQQALGAAGLSTQAFFQIIDAGDVTVDKLKFSLANFGPQAERAFQQKGIKTFSDEIGKLLATLSDGFGKLSGQPFGDFVIGALARIRRGIQDTIQEGEDLIALLQRLDKKTETEASRKLNQFLREPFGPQVTTGPTLEQARPPGVFDFPTSEQAGRQSAEAFNEGFLKRGFVVPPAVGEQAGRDLAADLTRGLNKGVTNNLFQPEDAQKIVDQTQQELDKVKPPELKLELRKGFLPPEDAQQIVDELQQDLNKTKPLELKPPEIKPETKTDVDEAVKFLFGGAGLDNAVKTFFGGAGVKAGAALEEGITQTPIVLPTEDQAALVEQFKQTGIKGGVALNEGAKQTPVDFSSWLPPLQVVLDAMTSNIFTFYDSIRAKFAQPILIDFESNSFLSGQPTNLAGGGQVRGRGTQTSDSNLAWLSINEFVTNARAVSYYGVGLFERLNAMALPRDFIGHFNMGGLVRSANSGNRLAAGGQVQSSGNPFTLKIDRNSFNMTAGDDTIQALKRFAVASQLSSTGRKPRYVR